MGLWHKCPNCGEMCEHDTLTREEENDHETMLLECEQCGHDWFATISIKESQAEDSKLQNERCPKCNSENITIDAGPEFVSDNEIEVSMQCWDCHTHWNATYDARVKSIEIAEPDEDEEDD